MTYDVPIHTYLWCAGPVTVMCYNVLCDKYATTQMYAYCPSWALAWDYRKKVILGEIRHYTADIITLQVRLYASVYNILTIVSHNIRQRVRGHKVYVFSPCRGSETDQKCLRRNSDAYRLFAFTITTHFHIIHRFVYTGNSDGQMISPREGMKLIFWDSLSFSLIFWR